MSLESFKELDKKNYIWEYYLDKRKEENEDTAVNMTLIHFWFDKELIKYFANKLEEKE